MKAFISYSHQDESYLELLHRHLAQLKRDGLINTWTDKDILAGQELNDTISSALEDSQLFLALISPDYINSNYCYDKEFETAQKMQKQKKITIIPIILEPCDWLNTPFKDYKGLPKDGKPVSEWSNKNNAMLDVIQNIRNLISGQSIVEKTDNSVSGSLMPTNYKVKKDFDSLQKMDFQKEGLKKLKLILTANLEEINFLENIKTRVLNNSDKVFEAVIVNRNKIEMESTLEISIGNRNKPYNYLTSNSSEYGIACNFSNNYNNNNLQYGVSWDEFELYWKKEGNFYRDEDTKKNSVEDIVNEVWSNWLERVGIIS